MRITFSFERNAFQGAVSISLLLKPAIAARSKDLELFRAITSKFALRSLEKLDDVECRTVAWHWCGFDFDSSERQHTESRRIL